MHCTIGSRKLGNERVAEYTQELKGFGSFQLCRCDACDGVARLYAKMGKLYLILARDDVLRRCSPCLGYRVSARLVV